jgi:hypothetical protein
MGLAVLQNLAMVPANAKNDVQIGKLTKKRSPSKAKKALVVMNDRSLGVLKHPAPLSVL